MFSASPSSTARSPPKASLRGRRHLRPCRDAVGSAVTNLVLLGQGVTPVPNQRFPLGDWGYAITLELTAEAPVADDTRNARAAVTALRVVLLADHGGLPVGTEILIGHAEASSSTPALRPGAAAGRSRPSPRRPDGPRACRREKKKKPLPKPPEPDAGAAGLGLQTAADRRLGAALARRLRLPRLRPVVVHRHVRRRRAPVSAGTTARTSSLRSARRSSRSPTARSSPSAGTTWADIGSGCATARETSSTTRISRRSRRSRWTAREVRAGAVVGFVGNTGDAQSTPYHLHFEIHPVGLLPMGYDGVVNSFPYLERVAAARGRLVRRRPRLGAAGAADRDGAEAGSIAARLDRHLERERARAGLARAGARRSGLSRRRRRPASDPDSSDPARLSPTRPAPMPGACTSSRRCSRR